jgi:FAD synthase
MNGVKYQAAISVGWNPQYDNKEKAVEAYLLNEFDYEFYGELMTLEFVSYLRAESSFKSLQELIQAIKNDVSLTKEILIE